MEEEFSIPGKPTTPEPPDYVNPLESSSRWYLTARAQAVRYAASLGFGIANRSQPAAPVPTREIWLNATLSEWKAQNALKVEIWKPPRLNTRPRMAVINFHGGGWILGAGTDDARWAASVMGALDAVVFSVNYRLAPSYPFPSPVEDCLDSIIQIVMRSAEFGIDPERIMLSGFSAGGNMALSTWIALQNPERWGYELPIPPPHIAGLALFYPLLDWTISRPEKRQTCARPDLTLSKGMTDLIDACYVYPPIPREQRTDLRLSPGLMPDELLEQLPPIHLCLCEYDMLLAEGLRFSKRLEAFNKRFTLSLVEGQKHGWDKPPGADIDGITHQYDIATESMAEWHQVMSFSSA
ncbi:alpha/beta hydrolase fold domain-containing protein [Sarocladium implicatum]|nr:alpha/beta hydrolase fold domain-containing protein [Sarocladium implicatum]